MSIDNDTSAWLSCPAPLEMNKHQCSLLEDELTQTQAMLRKARANIAGLVHLCDELTTGKASAELALKKELDNIARLNLENSDMGRKISSLGVVADQRHHLLRENQRLLMEEKSAQSS